MRPIGIVLAGGQSRRFGSDKPSAPFLGRPMLAWVVGALAEATTDLIVVAAEGQVLPPLDHPVLVLRDDRPGLGPAAGMVAAFRHVGEGLAFVAGADTPLLRPGAVRTLIGAIRDLDAAVPVLGGRRQPLGALYRVERCLEALEHELDAGKGSVQAVLNRLRIAEVDEQDLGPEDAEGFLSLDTTAARDEAERRARFTREGPAVDTPPARGQDRP